MISRIPDISGIIDTSKVVHKISFAEQKLCPICGEKVFIRGYTKDGRIFATCGDAFKLEQWIED